jgi:repressor LexA
MTTRTQPPGDDDWNGALTERQQKILACIRESRERRGYSPSLREIALAVGLKSTSAVAYQLKTLEEKGRLSYDPRTPRSVVETPPRPRVLEERIGETGNALTSIGWQEMVSVPLFERIAAGDPVIANPDPVGIMQLPREMVGSGVLFAVRVAGDSMVNANIFDGDCVVVRYQKVADNGDIVAARIKNGAEEGVTVKTFRRMQGHVWLVPQNPTYEPIPGDDCELMGKVVATIHRI